MVLDILKNSTKKRPAFAHCAAGLFFCFFILFSCIHKAQPLCQGLSVCLDGNGLCIHILAERVCYCLQNLFLILRRELA